MASTIKIDLGKYDATKALTVNDLSLIQIDVDGAGPKSLLDLGATLQNGVITIPDYGKLSQSATELGEISFVADADCKAGKYEFKDSTGTKAATWDKVDVSAMTGAFTLSATANTSLTSLKTGAGNDVIDTTDYTALEVIDAGAGNDTITFAVDGVSVKGGAGKDAFIQGDSTKAATIEDYKYAEGDTVKLAGAFGSNVKLDSDGKWVDDTSAAKITAQTEAIDNVYQAKVTDTAGTKEYWTAKKGSANVVMNGSKIADAMVIDATAATSAAIQGGFGNDEIDVTGSQVTLTAGKTSGTDTVTGFDAAFDGDVLNISGEKISNLTFTVDGKVSIGSAVVDLGATWTNEGKLILQENGGTAQKVAFATIVSNALTYDKDADIFVGKTLDVTGLKDEASIDLSNTAKYKSIAEVKVSKAGGTYIGSATGTKFTFANDETKASQVWGNNTAVDTIAFGTNRVEDIVWFGKNDGLDTMSGFQAGFGSESDAIYLYDVEDVSKLEFGGASGLTIQTNGSKNVLATGVTQTGATNATQIKLTDQSKTTKKVAVAVSKAVATLNGVGADLVIGHKNFGNVVEYGATQTDDLNVNLTETNKFINVYAVDASDAKGNVNVLIGAGSATVASTLTGASAAGTENHMWGFGASNDSIVGHGGAKDVVWFGAADGTDEVTAFKGGEDQVVFYDKSFREIANGYELNVVTANSKVSLVSSTDNKNSIILNGSGLGAFEVYQNDFSKTTVVADVAGTSADTVDFNKDAKIYFGQADAQGKAATKITAAATDEVNFYLGNADDPTWNDIYLKNIKEVDASGNTGNVILIGEKTQDNVLKGGKGTNGLWGLGTSSDELVGGLGVDNFWFGSGDGTDKVKGAQADDKVILHNVASIDDVVALYDATANNFMLVLKDGSSLDINAGSFTAVADGGLTFEVGVGEGSKSYTYDTAKKAFAAK